MLKTELPRMLNPFKFAEQHSRLAGELALDVMPRLHDVCHFKQEGVVKFFLAGGIDQQGFCYLKGEVDADIKLQCQRCLQPMDYHVKTEFFLSPVHDEKEEAKLPLAYEALYLIQPEIEIALLNIIEDEILLALPLVPKHSAKKCTTKKVLPSSKIEDAQKTKSSHPFAALKKLKKEVNYGRSKK